MPDSPAENSMVRSTTTTVQLSLPIAPLALQEAEGQREIVSPETSIEVQQRIEVIQQLVAAQGTERYGKLQQQAAKKLGMSVRSLQRLMKRWREQGLFALSKQYRVDHGSSGTARSCPCPRIRCCGLSQPYDCLPDASTSD